MSGWRAIMSDVNYGISNVGTVMTSCAGTQHITPYHAKLDRVKFGVPLDQVCRPDLPGPLLVSWRTRGWHQNSPFRKISHKIPPNNEAQSILFDVIL